MRYNARIDARLFAPGAEKMYLHLLDFVTNALFLAAISLPPYFALKWERRGFLAGVLSFWFCSALGFVLRVAIEPDDGPTAGAYLIGGWLVGACYCLLCYVIKGWFPSRPTPPDAEFIICPRCGGDLRNRPGFCWGCGPVPRKGRPERVPGAAPR